MQPDPLIPSILATWRRHQEILLYLLDRVPARGFAAVPLVSRGRDVARQFAHLDRVRRIWVHYHLTGTRVKPPRQDKGPPPPRRALKSALRNACGCRIRSRWMGCGGSGSWGSEPLAVSR